jgi:hypothetical protein
MIKARIVADSLLHCSNLKLHQYDGDLQCRSEFFVENHELGKTKTSFGTSKHSNDVMRDLRRFVTFELEYPRFIHSQMMTYSFEVARNTQSSRAVPVRKMIELVKTSNVQPVRFGSNKRGMQDDGESDNAESALVVWNKARENALESARWMMRLNIHKQAVNRLLEPFMPVRAVFTFSEASLLNSFFPERLNHDSDPTIQALAVKMESAFEMSKPTLSRFHIPYLDDIEYLLGDLNTCNDEEILKVLKASAVACAQVSYRKQDFSDENVERVWKILTEYGHGSPLEHVLLGGVYDKRLIASYKQPKPSGRFVGVRTLRSQLKT